MTDETKTERPPLGDFYDSLTWHDEQAIATAFDVDVHDLMTSFVAGEAAVRDLVMLTRAFELVRVRREGQKDGEALKVVRDLTNAQVTAAMEAYLDHEDEPMPEDPVTDEGKGDAPHS